MPRVRSLNAEVAYNTEVNHIRDRHTLETKITISKCMRFPDRAVFFFALIYNVVIEFQIVLPIFAPIRKF